MGIFGLAAGASSDFKSLGGTGGNAFLTYQPKLAKRDLSLVLCGGIHLPIGGIQRVLPTVNLSFVVY
ncbi:hypothetical protein [Hyalangium rubrum]|uniref:Uncharacterized protein n=1 Tax=Hyalangium rubrum TaxID=3103134 RepID=A0ABU5HJI1_9BACT|nr:hypothetical protein [Hyalangium sp. s54d21]MDY7233334.1 hypothetical protein [Hyalangium sp. s54d21]